ncbi:ABC transporter ATP-binding protein [bacterium]|nr:ABC transporter ATP-binding protein [bacterium]QQR57960.1 MAG: ABC transporter ATP-binding protein [Candidatus Melainabacteria bacterium]
MSANLVIEARGIIKDRIGGLMRKKTRILNELELKVQEGEVYGLLGPNGAGKTTTLKILLGLLKPDQGEISILGKEVGNLQGLAQIGFLPENPYFYSHLTGSEFLDFIAQLFSIKKQERIKRKAELLKLVKLETYKDEPMHKYSKGMLQRLGIAQSLINDPALIFWDEPMSGLDPIGRKDVREILRDLKSKGKTVLLCSHLLPDINDLCDRVGILFAGKLIAEEEVKNISKDGSYIGLEEFFLTKITEAQSHGTT